MTIDKYTKFLLTLIAVGIIGINFHLFKGSVVKDALAATANDWQVVKQDDQDFLIFSSGGKYYCDVYLPYRSTGWYETGC